MRPDGLMTEYLKYAKVAIILGDTLVVHGAIHTYNMGCVITSLFSIALYSLLSSYVSFLFSLHSMSSLFTDFLFVYSLTYEVIVITDLQTYLNY